MRPEIETLANGLRLLVTPLAHARSVSVSIYVGAGARYEAAPEDAGLSHFVEHLCFKGTERRPNPRTVAAEIDALGGSFNAATDRELTVYYGKVTPERAERAIDCSSTCSAIRCSATRRSSASAASFSRSSPRSRTRRTSRSRSCSTACSGPISHSAATSPARRTRSPRCRPSGCGATSAAVRRERGRRLGRGRSRGSGGARARGGGRGGLARGRARRLGARRGGASRAAAPRPRQGDGAGAHQPWDARHRHARRRPLRAGTALDHPRRGDVVAAL